jgi:hypothetical protein
MSKGLANPIPEAMIQDTYREHRETMTSVGQSPSDFLCEFRNVLQVFGEELKRTFSNKTVYPRKKGYYGFKRSEGGLRSALKERLRKKGFRERKGRIDRQATEGRQRLTVVLRPNPARGRAVPARGRHQAAFGSPAAEQPAPGFGPPPEVERSQGRLHQRSARKGDPGEPREGGSFSQVSNHRRVTYLRVTRNLQRQIHSHCASVFQESEISQKRDKFVSSPEK